MTSDGVIMSFKRLFAFGPFFLVFALLAGCFVVASPALAEDRAMMLSVDPHPFLVETDKGERRFSIEIAADSDKRARGLMFRKDMPDDRGMLFVFDSTQEVGFWMKNTPMPLDLVFIGQDGGIRAIRRGEPFSEAVISPGEPVRFVLELKAGTARKDDIKPGDRVRHPAIEAVARQGSPG
jgi:uncharacterized membrane protein (UPF0127 family)